MAAVEYRLSSELRGHEEDVRGVCAIPSLGIATASRDKTIRIWKSVEEGKGYTADRTLIGHKHFVGPVAWTQPGPSFPSGALISGSMDKQVIIWDLESSSILQTLQGHGEVITDVAATAAGDILSSSQDKTVRVWRDGVCVETLSGHESAVQAVVAVPTGEVVTGSSDCTIKVWKGDRCVHTAKGHTDTVRGLALMEGVGVASASHDGSVRLWAQSGEQLLEMVGHTALVYSVACRGTEIASGSEDNTAKVWQDGTCQQTLEHPGCVWDVTYLANGDLVTACSDGVARVWTREAGRVASQELQESYEVQLSATRKSQQVGGVKVEDLPGLEALQEPGKKDGQHKIIREGNTAVAYSWSTKEYNWEKIGEVVDGPSNPLESKTLDGVAYDYVFDVDIGDGVPPRKLPYNRGQNPYDVADRWLEEQGLPGEYREQVVQFIVANTGQAAPQLHNTFYDPYTGGQAYVPPVAQPPWASAGSTTGQVPQNADPYTGSSVRASPSASKPAALTHIPKKEVLLFDSAQYEGITKKLQEFNTVLAADEATQTVALSEMEMVRLQAILATLKDTAHYHSSAFADVDLALLARLLESWPRPNLFPVLDILRMMVLHPQAARRFAEEASKAGGRDVLLVALRRAAESPPVIPNHLTGLRIAVNAFRHAPLRPWTQQQRSEILDMFAECNQSTNKNVRLAWATLILNYAVVAVETADEEGQIHALSAALEVAPPKGEDPEVHFRALVAIGTLAHSGMVKSIAMDLDVKGVIGAAMQSQASKVAEIGRDLDTIFR